MLISSSLVSFKIVTALAKDMVNWEIAKKVIPNLYYTGEKIVLESIQNAQTAAINQYKKDDSSTSNNAVDHYPASTEYLVRNSLEALFAWIQMIVLWHDPYNSLLTLSGILSSFLLLTYFAPRFYATIMIALFVYNLTKLWFRHIWPEIRVPPNAEREEESRLDVDRWTYLHPHLITLNEFGQITSNLSKTGEQYLHKLLVLRREKPIKFCLIVCSILSCTAFIGSRISGMTLVFSILIALVSSPGIYLYLLPKEAQDYIRDYIITTFEKKAFNSSSPSSAPVEGEEKNKEESKELGEIEEEGLQCSDEEQQADGFVLI